MADSSSVDVILEFLKRNNFTRAEAALHSELSSRLDLNGVLQKLAIEDKGLSKPFEEANGGKPGAENVGMSSWISGEVSKESSLQISGEISEELIVREIVCGTGRNRTESKWKSVAYIEDQSKVNASIGTSDKNFKFSKGSDDAGLDLYSWKYSHSNGPVVSYPSDASSASANNFSGFQVSGKSKINLGEAFENGKANNESGGDDSFLAQKRVAWCGSTSKAALVAKNDKIQDAALKEVDEQHKPRKKMGSLPPLQFNFNCNKQEELIDRENLLNLFKTQQKYLNHFFQNLNLSQTLQFTQTLLNSKGTIFFTGVGKSGFVAQKISQTLVSLGIKSGFLSPVDALHGDIGILDCYDVLVMFSKSGNTEELLKLAPCAKAKGVYLISVTSVEPNALMGISDLNVHLPLERELCPFDLAPVTSTAIQMVFGDTVAIALMSARNFSKEMYAANHPAGKIGKSLIFKVKDVMKKKEELPVCKEGDLIMDQLVELTSKGCGCLLVISDSYRLIGTFTDGDLRRTLKASGEGIFVLTVGEMCNRNPRTIGPDAMAIEAMKKMESPPSPVQFLPVVDRDNVLIGIVTLHGLVSAGL